MKLLLLIFILTASVVRAHETPIQTDGGRISYATEGLLEMRGNLTPPPSEWDQAELNKILFTEIKNQAEELKKVKFYLLNGELRLAKIYLGKLSYTQTKLRPIIHRYLALIAFIEGRFQNAHEYLALPELQNIPHYGKICVLKVLTDIVISKTEELEQNWIKCKRDNYGRVNEHNQIWLDTLVSLKINQQVGATRIPFKHLKLARLNADETKIMLKLALYLNQEKMILDQLPLLELDQYQDPEIREIIAQIYFRTGALAKAYKFSEDLKTPNSENIKGNLYVLRKKYELAYAQFKLALEQKQNSQNAIERLLPLAWILGDWENGTKYAEQVLASPHTQINKMTLISAFLMQKGDYEESSKVLEYVAQRSRRGTEIDVTQVGSFNYLMLNKKDETRKMANMSCAQYDVLNCWLGFQLAQWDAFPLTIRRKEKIEISKEWEKLSREDFSEPIKEQVFIKQTDIEEMDDALIQLIPKT